MGMQSVRMRGPTPTRHDRPRLALLFITSYVQQTADPGALAEVSGAERGDGNANHANSWCPCAFGFGAIDLAQPKLRALGSDSLGGLLRSRSSTQCTDC